MFSDKITGSRDRDASKVILCRSAILGIYAIIVSCLFSINLLNLNGICRWSIKTCLLMIIPLYDTVRSFSFAHSHVITLRNLILAPVTEEIVFRGTAIGYVGSSLAFSLAHGHALLHDSTEWPFILVQIGITFLFGLYSYHIYKITGSVLTCTVVHCLCNFIGPPDIFSISSSYARIVIQLFCIAIAFFL